MPWETEILSRDKLYEQVWKEPVRKVAQLYDLSDVALAKICRRLDVPLPGRGYWARRYAGIEDRRPSLPPLKPGQPTQHRFAKYRPPEPGPAGPAAEPGGKPWLEIVVSETLVKPHPLVRMSGPMLRWKQSGERATMTERCLDVSVGPKSLNRALRLMDAILKALEERGHEIELTDPASLPADNPYSPPRKIPSRTGARIAGQFVQFWLEEKVVPVETSRQEGCRPTYKHVLTGQLSLRLEVPFGRGRRHTWSDGKRQRLEDCATAFCAALETSAEEMRLEAIAEERRRREAEAARREWEAAQRQQQAMKVLAKDLRRRLAHHRLAMQLREFVKLLEERLKADGADGDARDWLAWADWYIERLETSALERLLRRRHKVDDHDALRSRFGWGKRVSTSALVAVVHNPHKGGDEEASE